MPAQERLEAVLSHLAPYEAAASSVTAPPVDIKALSALLNGEDTTYRDQVFQFLKTDPLFKIDYNHTKESLRQITRARLYKMVREGFVAVRGMEENPLKWLQYGDAFSYFDPSVSTLIGAQFVLFTGSILHLGSEYHHGKFLHRAEKMELRGCFCMTELGHGSNVRGIETTAHFDINTDEWIIHTPTESAQKYWIGGGYEHAQMATVFAQLYIKDKHYGVHAFLVPLRDQDDNILPGVRIKDCGHKMGLNGIDNGRIWFDHVRIPRRHLLDRMSQVSRDGTYQSAIEDNDMRFAASMANLVTGRLSISRGATNLAKVGLATTVRYSVQRRQFGPPGNETPIMDYVTHQARLMPLLATTFAHHFIVEKATQEYRLAQQSFDMDLLKEFHILISGVKSITSWHNSETLQTCREACGGQGFKSSNRIGILKADSDIQLTYEGDNYVLLQQVSKELLKREHPELPRLAGDRELSERIDEAYLLSTEFQLGAFQLREADLVTRVAKEYREAKDKGMNPNDALQQCAMMAADAGRAHIEHRILKEFIRVETTVADPKLRPVLALLRSLYAIYRMDSAPSFLRGQYFSKEKQLVLHKLMLKLCAQTREIAVELVDSFAIPSFLLGEIAGDYIAANAYDARDRY